MYEKLLVTLIPNAFFRIRVLNNTKVILLHVILCLTLSVFCVDLQTVPINGKLSSVSIIILVSFNDRELLHQILNMNIHLFQP